jgi:hypothetical protein
MSTQRIRFFKKQAIMLTMAAIFASTIHVANAGTLVFEDSSVHDYQNMQH